MSLSDETHLSEQQIEAALHASIAARTKPTERLKAVSFNEAIEILNRVNAAPQANSLLEASTRATSSPDLQLSQASAGDPRGAARPCEGGNSDATSTVTPAVAASTLGFGKALEVRHAKLTETVRRQSAFAIEELAAAIAWPSVSRRHLEAAIEEAKAALEASRQLDPEPERA